MSYDDFGIKVDVQPPPADQVRDDSDTGSSGSVVQSTPLQGSSTPEQQKQVCDQMKAARAQMPAPTNDRERQQQARFDQALAATCD
jgi:hypothetical protein